MNKDLSRIRELVKEHPKGKIENLACYLDYNNLNNAHSKVNADKAVGIDKVTKDEYFKNNEENLNNLIKRMKSGAYKPQPSRRVYIPKSNGGKRPLGIPSYEDKLVQVVIAEIYGVTYNFESVRYYYTNVKKLIFKWLNRRSQKKSFNWEQFQVKWEREWLIPKPENKVSIISYTYS